MRSARTAPLRFRSAAFSSSRLCDHRREVSAVPIRRACVHVLDEVRSHLLEVAIQRRVLLHRAHLGQHDPDLLPDEQHLQVRGVEQLRVEHAAGHERGDHLPVRDHHAVRGVLLAAGRDELQPLVARLELRRAAEPLARLAQARLAAEFVELEDEVRVVVGGLIFHVRKLYRAFQYTRRESAMRSPAAAIAWELRQRHRWGVVGVVACLLVLAAIKISGRQFALNDETFALFVSVPLTSTCLYFLAVFSFGLSGDLAARQSMYPTRMFTLPVRTSALAGWPMLFGCVAMVALWMATRFLALWPPNVDVPMLWPALLGASLLAWTQALTWMPYGLPGLRGILP